MEEGEETNTCAEKKMAAINTINIEIANRMIEEIGPTFKVFGIKRLVFSHSVLSLETGKIRVLGNLPRPSYMSSQNTTTPAYDYTLWLNHIKDSLVVGSPIYVDLVDKTKKLLENIHVKLGKAEAWLEETNRIINKLHELFPGITISEAYTNKHYRCVLTPQPRLKIDSLSFEVGYNVFEYGFVEAVSKVYSVQTEIPGWGKGSNLLDLNSIPGVEDGAHRYSHGSIQGSFSISIRMPRYDAHGIGLNIPSEPLTEGYMLCPLIKSVARRGSMTEIGDFDDKGWIFDFLVSEVNRTITINNHTTGKLIYQFENCQDLALMFPQLVWCLDDGIQLYIDDRDEDATARFV